jgi:hypothetical protein
MNENVHLSSEADMFVKGERRGNGQSLVNEFGVAFVHSPRGINKTSCPTIKNATLNVAHSSVKAFVYLQFTNTNCSNM